MGTGNSTTIIDMLGLMALAGWALGSLLGLGYALKALGLSKKTNHNQRAVCLLLAMHCGEPALTLLWINYYFSSGLGGSMLDLVTAFQDALIITAPMVTLLTPAVAFGWRPSLFRDQALAILPWGLLRWIVSLLVNLCLNTTSMSSEISYSIAFIGVLILWVCMFRAHRMLSKQSQIVKSSVVP